MLHNSWQAGRRRTIDDRKQPVVMWYLWPLYQKCSHRINQWKAKVIIINTEGAPAKPNQYQFHAEHTKLFQLLSLISQQWAYDLTVCHQMSRLRWIIFTDIYLTRIAIFRYLPIYDSTARSTTKFTLYTNSIAVDLWYLRALETFSIAKYQLIHLLLSLILIKHTSVI